MDLSSEVMVHKKIGDVAYLQFKRLLQYEDKIGHCYTLKGENNANYKENDGENFAKVLTSLSLNPETLVKTKHQKHTNIVEKVTSCKDIPTFIDGLVTNQKEITLALTFADCTPIFIYDPIHNAIGDIHSGWKGTVQKIAQEGVKKMVEEYCSLPEELICCIGPCIGKCHFWVDEEVKDIFETTFMYLNLEQQVIQKGEIIEGKQKYHIDTNWINVKLLEEVGIKKENIVVSNICTVCHASKMHSYRVERENYGVNSAIIGLK